ncbi:MAG: T9SS type A sorting domain-containing protein [Candidatus Marinimicrobia bacterium]|jgi:hypothetical protein|nr:T9SS type A sorting domain-containing protein [Candidatus Neomarinimicrobiota bacterium]MBT3633033.1 T9SS type A sorting domain-containing protein [Candidatus Neomarinimicrobiota bacterium]MBT3683525.1 T9SS type A sorting domain-containing protein [Candidatus Neomarinimicrobiota bacterium]MBT3758633.1 T9SS type A sorting domain-containing protein [Candidatus Neomarinimicrobiota bacterium]MBT3896458.1 T9SS type A sorting domain-containing protein [Candidatus Neomarinimicrobiota bacterium]
MKYAIILIAFITGTILIGQHGHSRHPHHPDLSQDQQKEIQEMVETMKENGATKQTIQQAVANQFESWGLEAPENFGRGHHTGFGGPDFSDQPEFMKDLSDSQKEEIHQLVATKHGEGADPHEVHDAVGKLLDSWGIDRPDRDNKRQGKEKRHGFHGRHQGHQDLNKSQEQELHGMIRKMHDEGAPRSEIHQSVGDHLQNWGIERSNFDEIDNRHKKFRQVMDKLNDDQKDMVHELKRDMRDNGSSRKEIHLAVRELVAEWGIEVGETEVGDTVNTEDEASAQFNAQNYPNPFNPSTRISYTLNTPGNVSVSIYDVTGKMINSLGSGYQSAGLHSTKWDGNNQNGLAVPSGMYYYKIQTNEGMFTESMLLLK